MCATSILHVENAYDEADYSKTADNYRNYQQYLAGWWDRREMHTEHQR